jgi:hypothetical protein
MSDISNDVIEMVINEIKSGKNIPMAIKDNNLDCKPGELRKAIIDRDGLDKFKTYRQDSRKGNAFRTNRLKALLQLVKEDSDLSEDDINNYIFILQDTALELASKIN